MPVNLPPPPAGTQWVLHQNVQLHDAEVGETFPMVADQAGMTYMGYGWEAEYTVEPVWGVPGVTGNDRYFFAKWYFANFRLYLADTLTGETLAVQPGSDTGSGATTDSSSPYSAGQYVYVREGNAWVSIDTRIGSGPGWPPILHTIFTVPQLGTHQDPFNPMVQLPTHPPQGPGASLIQWRGDVWVAEAISSGTPPGPEGPLGPVDFSVPATLPVVLQANARPSPHGPRLKLTWPQRRRVELPGLNVGDVSAVEFPRWWFTGDRLVCYERREHWHASDTGQQVSEDYEREYVMCEFAGAEDRLTVWDQDAWDQAIWGT